MKKYIATIGALLLIAAATTAYAQTIINAKVTGGGSIATSNGGYATFGIVSQDISKNEYGFIRGNIEYIDHSGSVELNLHSDSIKTLDCGTRTTTGALVAWITGTATVNGISGIPFRIDVVDNGEPVGTAPPDEFSISINGVVQAGGPLLTGGNIQVSGLCPPLPV